MINEHSAQSTPLSVGFRTWLWRYTCLLLLISILWHRQAIFKSKVDKLSSSAECRIWTQGPRHQNCQQTECPLTNRLSYRGSSLKKTWTRQPVPMISEHSAHSTPLPVGFRNWLWRYTCLLLISMLWHRQAIFKSKRDKLTSSAECRIRSWEVGWPLTSCITHSDPSIGSNSDRLGFYYRNKLYGSPVVIECRPSTIITPWHFSWSA